MIDSANIINQVKLLCEQQRIKDNIVCLLNYGSVKQIEDLSEDSDLDFHIVLKKIDAETLRELKNVFSFSDKIDLSMHTLEEIVKGGKIFFQNGNQGLYFMHVLCSSEVLVGENIYLDLINKIDRSKVEISVIEKIRYYIWMLRRNYIGDNDVYLYKKYFSRILKDILIIEKVIDYSNISDFNNRQIINLYIENHKDDLSVTEIYLLVNIINLDKLKDMKIESTLILISDFVNKITWKNL